MATLQQPFDATQHNPEQGSGSLPIGKHPVIIDSSEVKATAAGDGGFVQFNLKVIDGPSKGATGAYRLNLYNANPKAVEIAHKQMSSLCHVTGVYQVQDSAQLHNKPFMVDVGPQKSDPSYTEVKKVFDINGNEPGKAGQGAQPAQAQQPAANGWGTAPAAPATQPVQAPVENVQRPQSAENGPSWGPPAAQQPVAPVAPAQAAAPAWGQAPAQGQPTVQQPQAPAQNAAPPWAS